MKLEHIEEIARCFHVYEIPEKDRIRISADYGRLEAGLGPFRALKAVYKHCEHHYEMHQVQTKPKPVEFCYVEGKK